MTTLLESTTLIILTARTKTASGKFSNTISQITSLPPNPIRDAISPEISEMRLLAISDQNVDTSREENKRCTSAATLQAPESIDRTCEGINMSNYPDRTHIYGRSTSTLYKRERQRLMGLLLRRIIKTFVSNRQNLSKTR